MKTAFEKLSSLEGARCSREEFWRRLESLTPSFFEDAARVTRWAEQELGERGVAYAHKGTGPVGGDLYLVAVHAPDVFVQFDADLEYIIVGDRAGTGEAGDWLEDRAAQALVWLEEALRPGEST